MEWGEVGGVTLMVINHSITHLSEFRQERAREGQRGLNWDGGMQLGEGGGAERE